MDQRDESYVEDDAAPIEPPRKTPMSGAYHHAATRIATMAGILPT